MTFLSATRGEHLHIRPHKGRMKWSDPVKGYRIAGYEVEDGRYQETVIVVEGVTMYLSEFLDTLPQNLRAETIPFPVHESCCDLRGG